MITQPPPFSLLPLAAIAGIIAIGWLVLTLLHDFFFDYAILILILIAIRYMDWYHYLHATLLAHLLHYTFISLYWGYYTHILYWYYNWISLLRYIAIFIQYYTHTLATWPLLLIYRQPWFTLHAYIALWLSELADAIDTQPIDIGLFTLITLLMLSLLIDIGWLFSRYLITPFHYAIAAIRHAFIFWCH